MWTMPALATLAAIASIAAQQDAQTERHCGPQTHAANAHPKFMEGNPGVWWGISTNKNTVSPGEAIRLNIWIENRTNREESASGCPPFLHEGDVFDIDGHRLISRRERRIQELRSKGTQTIDVCASATLLVPIPPHTCLAPSVYYGQNYQLDYDLPPGVYYVFPTTGVAQSSFRDGLKITVQAQ